MALSDPGFLAVTFVVIDFETLTPAGRPAEPIEVAAVAGRFTTTGQWEETWRYSSLMRPPDGVPVTRFDIAQNGLTAEVLRAQRAPGEVMAELDAQLADPPYRLVAHSARTAPTPRQQRSEGSKDTARSWRPRRCCARSGSPALPTPDCPATSSTNSSAT